MSAHSVCISRWCARSSSATGVLRSRGAQSTACWAAVNASLESGREGA